MATSVDLAHGTATRPKVPRLKVSAPPKQEIEQTHSESAGGYDTPSTIAPTILVEQPDNPDRNRYHKPYNQNPGTLPTRSMMLHLARQSRAGPKGRRD